MKIIGKKLYFLVGLTFVLGSFTNIENPILQSILNQFNKFKVKSPQQKIFIHFDRSFYTKNDTVWFKTYFVNDSSLSPESTNEIIYLDVYNENGKEISHLLVKPDSGFASSYFHLDSTFKSGHYWINAYTNYMRNFEKAFFYCSSFVVIDPDEPLATLAPLSNDSLPIKNIFFYPEGGNLVQSISSKVAFKSIDSLNNNCKISGQIIDSDSNLICNLYHEKHELGYFTIKPEKGKSYFAQITNIDGSKKLFPLPAAQEEGATLSIDNSNLKEIKAHINVSPLFEEKELIAVVQNKGRVVGSFLLNLKEGETTISIPKTKEIEGIVHFALFDSKAFLIAERIAYVPSKRFLNINVRSDKAVYGPREKVTLEIEVKDENGIPIAGNFSLAVTDSMLTEPNMIKRENIVSNLNFSSDLSSGAHPSPFILDIDALSIEKVDLFLLTQTRNRFIWNNNLNETKSSFNFQREKNISIRGSLDFFGGRPKNYSRLILSQKNDLKSLKVAYTDYTQSFSFKDLNFYGKGEFIIQTYNNSVELKNILVKLNSPSHPSPFFDQSKAISYLEIAPFVNNLKTIKRIETIGRNSIIKQEKGKEKMELEENLFLSRGPELKLSDYVEFNSMTDVFREIVPKVITRKKQDKTIIRVVDPELKLIYKEEPVFWVDGYILFNNKEVLNLDPQEVTTIEVLASSQINKRLRPIINNGLIIIKTIAGDFYPEDMQGSTRTTLNGFSETIEFKSKDYSNKNKGIKHIPDFRSLIYWNPSLKTNAEGKAVVSFYTSDNITTLNINIQGMSNNGRLGLGTSKIKVTPHKKP